MEFGLNRSCLDRAQHESAEFLPSEGEARPSLCVTSSLPQVLIRSGRVPIVSLECVSCKAQAVYEVSRSSYVYLKGHCHNCSSGSKQGVSSG
jgi:hypothetical protein